MPQRHEQHVNTQELEIYISSISLRMTDVFYMITHVGFQAAGCRQIGAETIFAALHGNSLTWKNSGLNTGAPIARSGLQREGTKQIRAVGSADG